MLRIKGETFLGDISVIIENEYFKCYLDKSNSCIICEALVSYIPVEDFIETFKSLIQPIKTNKVEKFIFDKRTLRAFNQPTMEWYFIEWKQQLLQLGVSKHRKMLPNEEWFKKCVEAGKASILKDNPNFPADQLDIQYFDTIKECIKY